jgi:simple sugar transport system ATP-binding protein
VDIINTVQVTKDDKDEILALENISKSFLGNPVLKNVTIRLKKGEILSLVGENGAGKSTLMNILFGMEVIKHTGGFQGNILFKGQNVVINSPTDALQLGIGMVHQEFMLIDDFSIAENIKLNKENTKNGIWTNILSGKFDVLDKAAMGSDARRALESVHLFIDEWTILKGLPIGGMQFIEIAKSLDITRTELIIFDEPTAALTESEADDLLDIIQELSQKGIACLFISHKLEEVLRVSDRIMVLRDGELVGVFDRGEINAKELAFMMVGRDLTAVEQEKRDLDSAPTLMTIKNLEVDMPGERVKGLSFDIKEGEIFGIGGLAGSGKLGVSNGIRGLFDTRGEITYKGCPFPLGNTARILADRIAFISEDRKKIGLMLDESIEANCVTSCAMTHGKFLKRILGIKVLDRKSIRAVVREMIETLDIRCTDMTQRVGVLSGGNQQKVCIAAMLLQEPELIFATEPSRGIDIGAKKLILDYLKKLNREQNTTVVVTSSELQELRNLCDRIAIIYEGKLAGILNADAPYEEFGLLMANVQ